MRPLIRETVEQFKRLPESQHVSHAWLFKDPDKKTMIKYNRPEWLTTRNAKYRGDAFNKRGDGGNGRDGRTVSRMGAVDITGYQTMDEAGGSVDPFGPII
jgi:hypothetical protein